MMNESRRNFLKGAGRTALGLGCALPLIDAAEATGETGHDTAESGQLAMVIDVQKCMRLDVQEACTRACKQAHSIPTLPDAKDEVKWLWTEKYENAFPDQAHGHTQESLREKPVLVLCNHCTNPPCVKVCPTKATWKRDAEDGGIVMMDMHRCIGCRYCIAACPYGARSFNWRDPRPFIQEGDLNPTYPTRTKGVVEKCNFCAERLRAGQRPACVDAVDELAKTVPEAQKAIVFGEFSEPDVHQALNENHTIRRRPGLGTEPNVFYIV